MPSRAKFKGLTLRTRRKNEGTEECVSQYASLPREFAYYMD